MNFIFIVEIIDSSSYLFLIGNQLVKDLAEEATI